MLENISVNELENMIGNINIIDIRSNSKYTAGHIKTSINILNVQLLYNYEKYLNKHEKYYIYCQYGKNSIETCTKLNKLGYNTINIVGGYDSWLLL